ncbi:alpha-D-ribose 1-methylphosphonate 5-triphosphate diphosphatase [Mucilaginibacter yixingensis]|uniref:Alpha-D-ribose 1-methylphosphonate 5-triphosphate diphosphatase n=1 Tax=Mucilaginibacter yixingensis TaxID=1295612 RepID=A0A2T5J4R0_9SPHI|nr:alpha-D-ribose 1-methylphosphonate 5-triphosphate diphosphatase [Mucilaginibacter yixingensis]
MTSFLITNARVVTPTEVLENASVQVEQGVIIKIDKDNSAEAAGLPVIDAQGNIVMPGIIDIHTDALDAEVIPRPGADIPVAVAFRELERKMSGCGFTTVYHSLHLGYEVAETYSRSKYTRAEIFDGVYNSSLGQTLLDNKIHLRFELSGVNSYDECFSLIDRGYVQLLSVMDHTPGQGQFSRENFMKMMIKSGKTEEQATAEFEELAARPRIEGEKLQRLLDHARRHGIPVASHDDDSPEKVDLMRNLGVAICEFPITMDTASHAAELGMHVVGGASNILRGGSLSGNVSMTEAVLKGYVDTLCSDYYPPAIIHSVFKLHREHGLPLPQAINLATLNPAKAVGIDAYTGSLEEGKDADLLIVRLIDEIPMVTHTVVKGNVVSQAATKIHKQNLETAF